MKELRDKRLTYENELLAQKIELERSISSDASVIAAQKDLHERESQLDKSLYQLKNQKILSASTALTTRSWWI